MQSEERAYEPIDCSLYDRYEEAATLKRSVELSLADGSSPTVLIKDLYVRDSIEWLLTQEGREIRLDAIRSMRMLVR